MRREIEQYPLRLIKVYPQLNHFSPQKFNLLRNQVRRIMQKHPQHWDDNEKILALYRRFFPQYPFDAESVTRRCREVRRESPVDNLQLALFDNEV